MLYRLAWEGISVEALNGMHETKAESDPTGSSPVRHLSHLKARSIGLMRRRHDDVSVSHVPCRGESVALDGIEMYEMD